MASVFAILGRLWMVIVGSIGGLTEASSVSPPRTAAGSGGARPKSPARNAGRDHKYPEALNTQREQFVWHPSSNSRDGDLLKPPDHTSGFSSKRSRRGKQSSKTTPEVRIEDWSSVAGYTGPPPRPPRPPSSAPPALIVTPSTPTGGVFRAGELERILTTAKESPLDRTIATCRSAQSPTTSTGDPGVIRRPVHDRKPGANPPTAERDITELKVNLRGDRALLQASSRGIAPSKESLHRSFRLPESLKRVLFEPLGGTTNVISAMSNILVETPPWVHPSSDVKPSKTSSYVTSTPVKLQRAVESDSQRSSSVLDISGSMPCDLSLPEEQLEPLPYYDVFDLDVYYGVQSGRYSVSTKDRSSSIVRCSVDDNNPFLPAHTSSPPTAAHVPRKSARRFGFVSDTPNPGRKENAPPTLDHVAKDQQHSNYSRPTRTSLRSEKENNNPFPVFQSDTTATPGSSTASSASDSGSRGRVLLPIPLRDLNSPTGTHPTHARTRSKHVKIEFDTPSPLPGPSKGKSRAHPPAYPPPPIVIVSHHRFASVSEASKRPACGSSSEDSEPSQEALRSRLEETCQNFSKSVGSWTDDSKSMDPILLADLRF